MFMNTRRRLVDPLAFDPYEVGMSELKAQPGELLRRLRLALLVHGVDVNGRIGGFLSTTHTEADVDAAVAGFQAAIGMLREEGELA